MESKMLLDRALSAWLGIMFGTFSLLLLVRLVWDGYLYLTEPDTLSLALEVASASLILVIGFYQLWRCRHA